MNKFWLTHVCIGLTMLAVVSCSKNDNDDIEQGKIEADIIGTWTASSGKYNLSLEITSSGYTAKMSVAETEWSNLALYRGGGNDRALHSKMNFFDESQCQFTSVDLMTKDTLHHIVFNYKKTDNTIILTPKNGGEKWELELENKNMFKFNNTGGVQLDKNCTTMSRNQAN